MTKNLYYINKYLIDEFQSSLKKEGFTSVTIKNYLADVNQFLKWRDLEVLSSNDEISLELYKAEIEKRFSGASVKRKTSVIKKYIAFENKKITSLPKESKRFSKATITPFAIGFSILILIPFVNSSFYKNESNVDEQILISEIPVGTIVSSSTKGNVYSFDSAKGVKVILTNDPLPDSASTINSTVSLATNFDDENLSSFSGDGTGTIFKGKTEAIIVNEAINPSSFIFLTPKSSTENQVLYISTQEDGYAIVSVDEMAENDIKFQWKVDNTEVYHSIL